MSFSLHTKNELSRYLPQEKCCLLSELTAFLVFSGSLEMRGGHSPSLVVLTELPDVARKIVRLAHDGINARTEVRARRKERLLKNLSYLVRVYPQESLPGLLEELSLFDESHQPTGGIPWPLLRKKCCRWSFLRGTFLAGGSVTNPEKSYHWEISVETEFLGEELIELLAMLGIEVKLAERKRGFIVYAKDSEDIAGILAGMGAYSAVLSLENTKVVKEMRNKVNRQVNCETANLDKTVSAAMRQIEAIHVLTTTGQLRRLPKPLRELAEVRVDNPSVSIKELGQLLDPPVGKSTVANRLRRLQQLADDLDK